MKATPTCCKKCKFFEHLKYIDCGHNEEGMCRRYPPNLLDDAIYKPGRSNLFPLVLGTDWCGEFKKK